MAYEIVVPRLGWSMEEGVFVRWLKRAGEVIRAGDALFEVEGEKASTDIEAVDGGILRIPDDAPAPGSTVLVGQVLGFLVADGEATPMLSSTAIVSAPISAEVPQPSADVVPRNVSSTTTTTKQHASPRARRVARELGLDWTQLSGSGAGGRIRERDVRAASVSVAGSGIRQPISQRRHVIADRLLASQRQTVPVTITTRADANQLVQQREQLKASAAIQPAPSYQDLILKLVADVLVRHPLLAARWDDKAIVFPAEDGFHLGIAVDTDEGLLVPVVRDVPHLSLTELAQQSRRLIERAKTGELAAHEMQGGIFTVTNLGAYGIDAFTPVINWPESAILGLGAIRREAVVLVDGQFASQWQITLSLTFDHRLIDGAPAAKFLQDLAHRIAHLPDLP